MYEKQLFALKLILFIHIFAKLHLFNVTDQHKIVCYCKDCGLIFTICYKLNLAKNHMFCI